MRRIAAAASMLLAFFTPAAMAAEILVHDAKEQPESMAVAADGTAFVGSASSPFIYRIKKGATTAETFADVSADGAGTFFFGQYADNADNTLLACELIPLPNGQRGRHSVVRGFDMTTGQDKFRWDLPDPTSLCNDFSTGPDKAIYIADTGNAKIFRMAPGATTADLWYTNRALTGIDGITFLDGVMYVTNVAFNQIYRVPVDAVGKPGTPVNIWTDAPIKMPDGMRAANGKLYVAENAAGKVDYLTINGDIAHVTVLKDGLDTPTGVEPVGNKLWYTERGTGKIYSMPLP